MKRSQYSCCANSVQSVLFVNSLVTIREGRVYRGYSLSCFQACQVRLADSFALPAGGTREERQHWRHFACTTRISVDRGVKRLLVLAKEVVVGAVRHERLIADICGDGATVSRGRSPFSV